MRFSLEEQPHDKTELKQKIWDKEIPFAQNDQDKSCLGTSGPVDVPKKSVYEMPYA